MLQLDVINKSFVHNHCVEKDKNFEGQRFYLFLEFLNLEKAKPCGLSGILLGIPPTMLEQSQVKQCEYVNKASTDILFYYFIACKKY